jgi:hypothetical protein
LAVAGCDDYRSDNGLLGFRDEVLMIDRVLGFRSGGLVAAGSRACPSFEAWYRQNHDGTATRVSRVADDDGWLRDCFTPAVSGPGTFGPDGCISFDDVGEVRWDVSPVECTTAGSTTFFADSVRFAVVEDDLEARFDPYIERFAAAGLHPGPAGSFPADFTSYLRSPLRAIEGGTLALTVILVQGDAIVAWSDGDVQTETIAGTPQVISTEELDRTVLRLGAGDQVDVALDVPGGAYVVGSVVGVDGDVVDALEIVVGYWPTDDEAGPPMFARVVARDEQGAVLHGVPVQWSVTAGKLSLYDRDSIELGSDYVSFGEACLPPPRTRAETRTATLEARFDDLTATVDLVWRVPPIEDDEFSPEPDPNCEGPGEPGRELGCGCWVAHGQMPHAWWLPWIVVAGWRRRRAR